MGYLWATHVAWASHRAILGHHRKCMGYPWVTHGLPMRYPPHHSEITVNLWTTHGRSMGYLRAIHGIYAGCSWATHRLLKGYPWATHGPSLVHSSNPCTAHGQYMSYLWASRTGVPMGCPWAIAGSPMEHQGLYQWVAYGVAMWWP